MGEGAGESSGLLIESMNESGETGVGEGAGEGSGDSAAQEMGDTREGLGERRMVGLGFSERGRASGEAHEGTSDSRGISGDIMSGDGLSSTEDMEGPPSRSTDMEPESSSSERPGSLLHRSPPLPLLLS